LKQEKICATILAGGSGSRLWPLSRQHLPKQFLSLDGDVSLLQTTINRLLDKIFSLTSPFAGVVICAVQPLNAPQMLDESTHYGLLKTLENNPSLSQRDLAKRLDISLGKVNFCLNALVAKGSLKINNFRNSDNKLAYAYLLTPHGIEEKARMTVQFLKFKVQEYERLRAEIEELQREAAQKSLMESAHE
jgi:EPS-associated MarR family transcriptional regulator